MKSAIRSLEYFSRQFSTSILHTAPVSPVAQPRAKNKLRYPRRGDNREDQEILYKKIKENVRKTLSPASVDKSVDKITLPAKYCAFLYL